MDWALIGIRTGLFAALAWFDTRTRLDRVGNEARIIWRVDC